MKKRVLIIDGDEQLNKINEKILHSSGIVSELHITASAKEAIEYLTSRLEKNYPLPHVIIFDLQLPVADGFQFLDAFDSLDFHGKSQIALVVFTASSNPNHKLRALSKGIKYYISKPYLLRGLRDVIAQLHTDKLDAYKQNRLGIEPMPLL